MYASVSGARIFFDTVGAGLAIDGPRMTGKPTLIVMHGGPGFDHTTMRPFFDRFADTHQVVYIDHRCNGRSTGELPECTLARWGDDVREFCDVLGIEQPVVYGNSFGGMVAMSYAARHPGHAAKLILSSTAARMHWDETFRIFGERGGPQVRAIAETFWKSTDDTAIAEYMRVCMPLYNPPGENAEAIAAARARAILRGDTLRYFSTGEMRTMDARAGLSRISCPTLITVGDYDPITPVTCSREIFAALPKGVAQLEIFEGAGHGVHRDQPDEAEAVMRKFLAA
ncbi:MAG: alpha/beta fold hydrolase [Alphaproteobacteria bacterium]|nr:alpha/beta fold hydrolase [Alphaproteobacteria bacterium]